MAECEFDQSLALQTEGAAVGSYKLSPTRTIPSALGQIAQQVVSSRPDWLVLYPHLLLIAFRTFLHTAPCHQWSLVGGDFANVTPGDCNARRKQIASVFEQGDEARRQVAVSHQ